jgi:hypothetical protein
MHTEVVSLLRPSSIADTSVIRRILISGYTGVVFHAEQVRYNETFCCSGAATLPDHNVPIS